MGWRRRATLVVCLIAVHSSIARARFPAATSSMDDNEGARLMSEPTVSFQVPDSGRLASSANTTTKSLVAGT